MTDLEDLWSDYPTPPPPTDALLRQARAEARVRRRRLVVRPLLAGLAAACVAGVSVVAIHPHGSSNPGAAGDSTSLAGPALRNAAFQADLHPASSCDQLLAGYRTRAADQVTAYGWRYAGAWGLMDAFSGAAAAPLASAASASRQSDALAAVGSSATGTNVQETGVDEPDEVKTNGSLLARVHDATLSVYDLTGPAVRRTARITLPRLGGAQLLLSGTTLVALGSDTGDEHAVGTRVETVSLADPAHPAVTSEVRYSGTVASARQHGSVVRLVLAEGLPTLPFVHPHGQLGEKQALAKNRSVVQASTLDDWLPRYDPGSGSRPLLGCGDVALAPAGLALGTESVVGFDVAAPTRPHTIGIAGQTEVAYESADHLYLAAGRARGIAVGGCPGCAQPLVGTAGGAARTRIFQFDLDGTAAAHVATGRVEGTLADRWSMDEAGGVLRVAVTHGNGKKRASAVVTMRPDGSRLVEVGRLDGLGVDEKLTAARWFDDLAILSTARQTDPLFTVDLTHPDHPVLLGALHIPGYSTYLHPIGHGQLLGVGQKVSFDQGHGGGRGREHEQAQVGLFDIGDLTDVHQLAVSPLQQWTWPTAGDDPRAFTWLADRGMALTSFSTRQGRVLLGEYRVSGTSLSQRLITLPVRAGRPVRTMELPSGKVVLIAGGHVSFLAL